jgi:hypothetical protein
LVKVVFDLKERSGYKDSRDRYHFPNRSNYLAAARAALGDWALIREPQRDRGRRAYVAVARVVSVEPDPADATHHYAQLADYLEFATPVPFVTEGRYHEAPLRAIMDPTRVGQAVQGKSLRNISDADFDEIVLAGLSETLAPENSIRLDLDFPPPDLPPLDFPLGVAETIDRRVEQMLMNRKIRDANFRLEVCRAYGDKANNSDRAPHCDRQVIDLTAGLYHFVDKIKVGRASEPDPIDGIIDGLPSIVSELGKLGVVPVPVPRPNGLRLGIDAAAFGEPNHGFNSEFVFGFSLPVVGIRQD